MPRLLWLALLPVFGLAPQQASLHPGLNQTEGCARRAGPFGGRPLLGQGDPADNDESRPYEPDNLPAGDCVIEMLAFWAGAAEKI